METVVCFVSYRTILWTSKKVCVMKYMGMEGNSRGTKKNDRHFGGCKTNLKVLEATKTN